MSLRTSPWPHGIPCWTDLTVPDVTGAQLFYGRVLGWTFAGNGEGNGGYTIAQVGQAAAAGIGPTEGEAPSVWTLYFASDHAEATAAAVTAAGGSVLLPPSDVGPLGRVCIAADPTGAPFGVWQAGTHIGAGVVNEPGGLTWEDLRSPDPATAQAFYSAVFGYRIESLTEAGPDYALFSRPDEQAPLGGIGGMEGADGPPHWLVYFCVADADAAAAACESAGGTVVAPPFATPYGRMAGLADPFGALFRIAQTEAGAQPDRTG